MEYSQSTGLGPTYLGIVIGGAVGYVLTALLLSPVDAGCKTLFVCYAEEPQGLESRVPELAEKLKEGGMSTENTPLAPAKGGGKADPLVAP